MLCLEAVAASDVHRDVHQATEAIFRIESARLIAGLARIVRDVGLAEELAQDALVIALERWPVSGIPDNPGAWLMATAKHRAIDELRRRQVFERKQAELGHVFEARQAEARQAVQDAVEDAIEDDMGDDLLRLVFTACHPILSPEARVALTLRLLGGLDTAQIARAYLVPEPTIAQRIVRAKRALSAAAVPFAIPSKEERAARLSSVLEVIYLIFNEGYAATAGDDWMRPELCQDALRLGRILAGLVPQEPEVHGLVSLMEIQASRIGARTDASGAPILLLDQNRARWDRLLIQRGLVALELALKLGDGPYTLQAAIAACHARARTAQETDWTRIVALYQSLAAIAPSPVVELNRAVAVAMASGPAAGLAIVDALVSSRVLAEYHLLPAVRGDFLAKLGRLGEARPEFERAAALAQNARERHVLYARAAACARVSAANLREDCANSVGKLAH